MSLKDDKQQNTQIELDFASAQTGEAREAGRDGAEPSGAMTGTENPARIPSLFEECQRNRLEPPCTDPYARWCGRGRRVTAAPMPINVLYVLQSSDPVRPLPPRTARPCAFIPPAPTSPAPPLETPAPHGSAPAAWDRSAGSCAPRATLSPSPRATVPARSPAPRTCAAERPRLGCSAPACGSSQWWAFPPACSAARGAPETRATPRRDTAKSRCAR